MPEFSKRSKDKLKTCDKKLQDIANEIIKHLDITIVTGFRGAVDQDTVYENGYSKVKFPNSKHNVEPSEAYDRMIYNKSRPHIRWDDKIQMAYLAGYEQAVADLKRIDIIQGADWDGNKIFNESFFDGAHTELNNG